MLAADNTLAMGGGSGRTGPWLVSMPEKQHYHMEATMAKSMDKGKKEKKKPKKK